MIQAPYRSLNHFYAYIEQHLPSDFRGAAQTDLGVDPVPICHR